MRNLRYKNRVCSPSRYLYLHFRRTFPIECYNVLKFYVKEHQRPAVAQSLTYAGFGMGRRKPAGRSTSTTLIA